MNFANSVIVRWLPAGSKMEVLGNIAMDASVGTLRGILLADAQSKHGPEQILGVSLRVGIRNAAGEWCAPELEDQALVPRDQPICAAALLSYSSKKLFRTVKGTQMQPLTDTAFSQAQVPLFCGAISPEESEIDEDTATIELLIRKGATDQEVEILGTSLRSHHPVERRMHNEPITDSEERTYMDLSDVPKGPDGLAV